MKTPKEARLPIKSANPVTGSSPVFLLLQRLHQELKSKYGIVDDIYLHPDSYQELVAAEKLAVAADGDARGRLTVVTSVGPVDIKSHPFGAKLGETIPL